MAAGGRKTRGLFVTFEGIDGCGKSTQMANACCYLTDRGYAVSRFREPGSTPAAERIRKILLDPRSELSDITELLLYEAARAEIVARQIRPALAAGHIVLCDRFYDSTTAYQGYGRKLDIAMVRRLHKIVVGDIVPDLTLVLDVDVKTSCARRGKRPDRLESQSRAFFNRVRRGFHEIAKAEPRRVKLIDSVRPIDEVFADIIRHLNSRLRRR